MRLAGAARTVPDDPHGATAIGTGGQNLGWLWTFRIFGLRPVIGLFGWRLGLVCCWRFRPIGQQGTAQRQLCGAVAVGHEAEMANAVEAVGQRGKRNRRMNSSGVSRMILAAPFWR